MGFTRLRIKCQAMRTRIPDSRNHIVRYSNYHFIPSICQVAQITWNVYSLPVNLVCYCICDCASCLAYSYRFVPLLNLLFIKRSDRLAIAPHLTSPRVQVVAARQCSNACRNSISHSKTAAGCILWICIEIIFTLICSSSYQAETHVWTKPRVVLGILLPNSSWHPWTRWT